MAEYILLIQQAVSPACVIAGMFLFYGLMLFFVVNNTIRCCCASHWYSVIISCSRAAVLLCNSVPKSPKSVNFLFLIVKICMFCSIRGEEGVLRPARDLLRGHAWRLLWRIHTATVRGIRHNKEEIAVIDD